MALILNIETATDICSVCISKGDTILDTKEATEAYSHTASLTLLIEACSKDAGIILKDLDAIAVSTGPGSYTALRVGASTAKGLCYALDKPMIAIDTLLSLAAAAHKENPAADYYIPMIDARRMEVYTTIFNNALNRIGDIQNLILDEESFDRFLDKNQTLLLCGNGAPKSQELYANSEQIKYTSLVCSASHLAGLSQQAFQENTFVDIAYFKPNYFKAPNITKAKKVL